MLVNTRGKTWIGWKSRSAPTSNHFPSSHAQGLHRSRFSFSSSLCTRSQLKFLTCLTIWRQRSHLKTCTTTSLNAVSIPFLHADDHLWSLFVLSRIVNLYDLLSFRQKASGDFSGQDHCSDPKTKLWPVWVCLSGRLLNFFLWKLANRTRIDRNQHGRLMIPLLAPNYKRAEQTLGSIGK